MKPVTVTLPDALVSLVEAEAHRLLTAQEAVTSAIARNKCGELRRAAQSLCIASSQMYGALSVALRDQAGLHANAQAVRPEVQPS